MSDDPEEVFFALPGAGDDDWVQVVGESHYQEALDAYCGGRTHAGHERETRLALMPEPTNPYDPNAVKVMLPNGATAGYLSREDAKRYRTTLWTLMDAERCGTCAALIRGGWDRGEGDVGNYGVSLDLGGPRKCLNAVRRAFPGASAPPPPRGRPRAPDESRPARRASSTRQPATQSATPEGGCMQVLVIGLAIVFAAVAAMQAWLGGLSR